MRRRHGTRSTPDSDPAPRPGAGHDEPSPRTSHGWALFLAVLFVVAAAWRLVVLARLARTPLLDYRVSDAELYWAWAGVIRTGRLVGDHPFFLGPLYAYALAGMRALFGDSVRAVATVQSLLGAASVVLLADAARRLTSARAGGIVGIALAGWSMLVLFDMLVLMETLQFLLGSGLLWCLVVYARRPRSILIPGAIGLGIGLMALGRPLAVLLLVPAGAAALAVAGRRRGWVAVAFVVSAVALAALPSTLHHRRVSQAWIPFTYSFGYNLYVGNGPGADGTYRLVTGGHDPYAVDGVDPEGGTRGDGRSFVLDTRGVRLSAPASSRYYAGLAAEAVSHDPARALTLYARKLGLLLVREEVPQVECPETYASLAGPLGWPVGVEFALLAVFGVAGALGAWRRGAAGRAVLLTFLMLWLGIAAFFVVDRFRLQLVAPLMLMAACGIEDAWRAYAARRLRPRLEWSLAAALGATLALNPLIPRYPSSAAWASTATLGEAWLAKGEPERALSWLERSAACADSAYRRSPTVLDVRLASAEARSNLGIAYESLGNRSAALACYRSALERNPDLRVLRARYGRLLALTGAISDAHEQLARLGYDDATLAFSMLAEADRAAARGDSAAFRSCLAAAVAWAPGDERVGASLLTTRSRPTR